VISVIFVFSENFPETAWRAFKAARGLCYFMVFLGSRDGTTWRHHSIRQVTLGDLPSFLGFGLNCLAVTINRQATRTFSFIFGISGAWAYFFSGRKLTIFLKNGLDILMLV